MNTLLVAFAYVGGTQRTDKLSAWGITALLILQGGLVHVHHAFDLPIVAALHPVNALVLTWAVITVARRSGRYWTAESSATSPKWSLAQTPSAG